jgi:ABC-type phosphate/phosphonate transport system substrate-binding protein
MRKRSTALGIMALLAIGNSASAADRFFGLLVGEKAWLPQAEAVTLHTDFENGTRIVPLIGTGAVQALQDLNDLQNIDAAIITADSLLYAQGQKLFNAKIETTTNLGQLNIVLLTNSTTKNLTSLAGKRIATGPAQSAGFAAGELIFAALEIPFLRVPQEGKAAIAALQNRTADAALVLMNDADVQDLKLKALPLPLPMQLSKTYQTTTVNVLGRKIDTLSVPLQLITLHSNQSKAVKSFQALLTQNIDPTIIPKGGKP